MGHEIKKFTKKKIERYRHICVVENHLQDGGFQSWLNESNLSSRLISKSLSPKVIDDVGSEDYLMKYMK